MGKGAFLVALSALPACYLGVFPLCGYVYGSFVLAKDVYGIQCRLCSCFHIATSLVGDHIVSGNIGSHHPRALVLSSAGRFHCFAVVDKERPSVGCSPVGG